MPPIRPDYRVLCACGIALHSLNEHREHVVRSIACHTRPWATVCEEDRGRFVQFDDLMLAQVEELIGQKLADHEIVRIEGA